MVGGTDPVAGAASRYRELRTLRTRATGTPFRVIWRDGHLIVIPGSGVERVVTPDEITRTWPLIRDGATLTTLKQLSNNSSYLEAIFDDVSALQEPASLVGGALETPLAPVSVDEIDRLTRRLEESGEQVEDLRHRLKSSEDRVVELDRHRQLAISSTDGLASTIDRLTKRLRESEAEVGDLEARLKEADKRGAELEGNREFATSTLELATTNDRLTKRLKDSEAQISDLQARLKEADMRGAEFESRNDAASAELESTIVRLRRELLTLRTDQARLESVAAVAHQRIRELEAQETQATRVLSLNIDNNVFDSKHAIIPELWEILHEAGQLAFKFPSSSVATSRRAIETAVGHIWRDATGGVGTPRVADMLGDLYGHRLMPVPDWHLAKNLHRRANGIVHEGTNRADLALWIFFGSVQICELVQPRSASQGAPDV